MRSDLGLITRHAQANCLSARRFEQATRVLPGGNTRNEAELETFLEVFFQAVKRA